MNLVMRFTVRFEIDCHHTGGSVGHGPNEFSSETEFLNLTKRAAAAIVISNGANETYIMPEPVGVHREVERRAAQMFARRQDIPKNLADADDPHARFGGEQARPPLGLPTYEQQRSET